MTDSAVMHVLLVSGRGPSTDWLITTLRAEKSIVLAGAVASLERAAEMVNTRQVDLILLDTAIPDAKHLDRLQALTASPMGPAVILMVDPMEVAFVQQALFAGARGFLLKPFSESQLTDNLRQAFAVVLQQRQAMSAAAGSYSRRSQTAQILAVFSPKAGMGCTSLATNLAVALHQETRKPVTLMDGDLQFGDVDIAVNAIAHTSVADLLGYVNDLEPALIESALVSHSTGIRLLLAPAYFDPALETSESKLPHLVKTVATSQDGHVIVDTPAGLGEVTLSLLDVAHRILLVTLPTLASLRATKRFLELTTRLDYTPGKVVLVLNGHRKDMDLPIEEIERHLNYPVAGMLPSDPYAMALSLSQGQPVVSRDKNHAVSRAIAKLARQLAGETAGDAAPASELNPIPPAPEKRAAPQTATRITMLRPRQALG